MLIGKTLNSLKWRIFYALCRSKERGKKKQEVLTHWKCTDAGAPPLVCIVYEADIYLLDRCLFSLQKTQKLIPPLILIGDSDGAFRELQRRFSFESVTILHWSELMLRLSELEQLFVRTWLDSGRWGGYSKKFAITLALQREKAFLLTDADVLWFSDILGAELRRWEVSGKIRLGEDYNRAYDLDVVRQLGEDRLALDKPINCGFVFYPKNSLDALLFPETFKLLLPFAQNASNHLEQTIIGYAFWRGAGIFLTPAQLQTTMEDNFRFSRGTGSVVRHYAGAKHLFWRDA